MTPTTHIPAFTPSNSPGIVSSTFIQLDPFVIFRSEKILYIISAVGLPIFAYEEPYAMSGVNFCFLIPTI